MVATILMIFLRINLPSFNLEARPLRSCIQLLHCFNTICARPKNGTFGVSGRPRPGRGTRGKIEDVPGKYGTAGNPRQHWSAAVCESLTDRIHLSSSTVCVQSSVCNVSCLSVMLYIVDCTCWSQRVAWFRSGRSAVWLHTFLWQSHWYGRLSVSCAERRDHLFLLSMLFFKSKLA